MSTVTGDSNSNKFTDVDVVPFAVFAVFLASDKHLAHDVQRLAVVAAGIATGFAAGVAAGLRAAGPTFSRIAFPIDEHGVPPAYPAR